MKCQQCCKNPKFNVQKTWITYEIPTPGEYGPRSIPDNQDPKGDDNLFLCKKCYLKMFDAQREVLNRGDWMTD